MFAAALLDAFPELWQAVQGDLAAAGLAAHAVADLQAVKANGIAARHFTVTLSDDAPHPTGHYADIKALLEASALDRAILRRAIGIFDILAVAEGKVHGVPPDRVHFHEIADWDSLVDIVAAASLIERVGADGWSVSRLPSGSGMVKTAHGLMPVPAPATAEILKGFDLHDDGVPGERITPTGAAILRHLLPDGPAARPGGRIAGIGTGAGTKRFEGVPNILRVLEIDMAQVADGPLLQRDHVAVLAFEVDDMTPEMLAIAADRLRAGPGVRDVSYGIRYGKKGRVQFALQVLAEPDVAEAVAAHCMTETTTLGVRLSVTERLILERENATHAGLAAEAMPVKRARRPDGSVTVKVEADALALLDGQGARERRSARAVLEMGEDGLATQATREGDND